MNIYYIDGKFVPADQALIPVDDLAVIRGIGVFDLLRTYHKKPLFLQEHVDRLLHSARQINLDLPWRHSEICRIALETLSRNHIREEANIRIIITGGSSADFMTPQGNPRLLVLISPLPKLPEKWYIHGVKVISVKLQRQNPAAKSINYLPASLALRKAQAQGAVEVIYVDDHQRALEGATSNLFAFIGGRLVTPGQGVLAGITRQVVLKLAAGYYPVKTDYLPMRQLVAAQEVFLTGTNKGLVPVIQIDDSIIGDGRPGPETRHLMTLLDSHLQAFENKTDAEPS